MINFTTNSCATAEPNSDNSNENPKTNISDKNRVNKHLIKNFDKKL